MQPRPLCHSSKQQFSFFGRFRSLLQANVMGDFLVFFKICLCANFSHLQGSLFPFLSCAAMVCRNKKCLCFLTGKFAAFCAEIHAMLLCTCRYDTAVHTTPAIFFRRWVVPASRAGSSSQKLQGACESSEFLIPCLPLVFRQIHTPEYIVALPIAVKFPCRLRHRPLPIGRARITKKCAGRYIFQQLSFFHRDILSFGNVLQV